MDSSFNMVSRLLKFSVGITDMMQGTVSQFLLLRPWFLFYGIKKMVTNFMKCFPFFDLELKLRPK